MNRVTKSMILKFNLFISLYMLGSLTLCLQKAAVQMLLEENCKLVNQRLHYSNEFMDSLRDHNLSF